VHLPLLAHDEVPGPYITIPQYRFNKTKQHTHGTPRCEYLCLVPMPLRQLTNNVWVCVCQCVRAVEAVLRRLLFQFKYMPTRAVLKQGLGATEEKHSKALQGTTRIYILARRILKANLSDGKPIKTRWPKDACEVEPMYLIAETLVTGWERLKNEFKTTKTFTDKNLLIGMMCQPWKLCDNVFTMWSAANKITLPARKTLRTVAAEHLYSAQVCPQCHS